ncbi:MAG: hypothetical protein LUE27_05520 [Clostridia bacterium]|nr:hypothetical protein [Clostridia bacterium]
MEMRQGGLTVRHLQAELCKEIKDILKGSRYKNESGAYVPVNVFAQNLPIRESDGDPEPVPYVIVRIEEGKVDGDDEPQMVSIMLLVGCFDDSPENKGHEGVAEIIEKIGERFLKEPMLAHAFVFQYPYEWTLQDEPSFPYFFGAAFMDFKAAAFRKEDLNRLV